MPLFAASQPTTQQLRAMTDPNEVYCANCMYLHGADWKCFNPRGWMYGCVLDEENSIEPNGCKYFRAARYRYSQPMLLALAMEDHGVGLPFDTVKLVWQSLITRMIQAGIIPYEGEYNFL